jgi:hypothetical protein
MKTTILACLLGFSLAVFTQESINLKELRQQQITNIHNPELWDLERMKEDNIPLSEQTPIKFGAFPVPRYEALGPYRGGGVVGNAQARSIEDYRLMVADKEVVFNSFFIGDSPFYKDSQRNSVFFTIITVVDSVDTNNFVPGTTMMLSRNHPDYGGEGSLLTKNNRVDYVAFTTPDKGSFAIVNMRLFHLEYGNIILVTPQKDGSFRSLQIKAEKVNNEQIFNYVKKNILTREDVVAFLTDKGVI